MQKGLLVFAVAIFMAQPANADTKSVHRMNDTPLLCRAVFGMLMKTYEYAKDAEKTALYRSKFDGLLPEAAEELEARGQSKDAVDAHIQSHVDHIGQMVLDQSKMRRDEKKLFPQLVAFCDKTYP
jgi:hypothetical protein